MDKTRWLDAFANITKKKKDSARPASSTEEVYMDFDAPLVQVKKEYSPQDQDELKLCTVHWLEL
jgi:hypothetical protein